MPTAGTCLGQALLDPVCQGLGGVGSSLFGAGAGAALDAMSHWVATGAAWLLGQIGGALSTTTQISFSAPWFLDRYRSMEGLLVLLALPLLLAAALQAIVQSRPSILLRAALVQLPLAMILSGAAVQLTAMVVAITDQLCQAVTGVDPSALGSLTSSLASALTQAGATGTGAPAFIVMLCAALVAMAALVLWIELVLRAAAVYVGVLFLPLALACSIWPALSAWCRRLVETLLALILAKLVVVVVLETAVGALGDAQGRGFSTVVTGVALLALATMAPFTLLRLLPMFEASAALALDGLRQRGTGAATRGLPRQGASLALDALRAAPELAAPAALAMASLPGHQAIDQLDSVGERSDADPMASSAITSDEPPQPAPLQSASHSGETAGELGQPSSSSPGRAPLVADWPRGAGRSAPETDEATPRSSAQPPARPPSLVLERDEWGPVIRPRDAEGNR